MNRREVLKYTALLSGSALSAPLVSSVLSGCTPQQTGDNELSNFFFSPDELELIKSFVDTILPRSESPSATDVGVHTAIDNMVGRIYKKDDKEAFRTSFDLLKQKLEGFSDKSAEVRDEMLLEIENSDPSDLRAAYLDLKQQTLVNYLMSEEIGEKYLNYLPVPGEWDACISLDEVGGKAWAI